MSNLLCFLFLVLIVFKVSLLESTATVSLCDNQFCVCAKDIDRDLPTLDCSFDFQQDVVLSETSLPTEDFVSIKLNNINELKIAPNTFKQNHWNKLKHIRFQNINKLNLLPQYYGSSSSIYLKNVTIPEISSNAFRNFSQLHIVSSTVRLIQRNAFSALSIPSIIIENTSIHHVEGGAFSERTLVHHLKLDHVHLKVLDSNAVVSAITKLSIQHSNISDIYSGGINITVASAQLSNNIFKTIKQNGIILNSWNYIAMENNTFKSLQTSAVSIFNTDIPTSSFKFVGNALGEVEAESLNFRFGTLGTKANKTDNNIDISINENYFVKTCNCDFYSFVRHSVNSDFVSLFYETSYCNINLVLSECFKKPEGLLNIKNFTDTICVQNIICNTKTNIETTKTRLFPGLTSTFDIVFEGNENEDILVRYACIALVILMIGILLCITCLYIRQNRVFSKVKSNVFMNLYSKIFTRNSSDKCPTKTNMLTNDYYKLDKQIKLDMSDIVLGSQEQYEYTNKATQTLPEELTQELLQNLRVKLEDPNEYCLARDMIEHLYDLIKIEESCNRNVYSTRDENHYMSTPIDKGDNIYDEIEIRPSRADTSNTSSNIMKPISGISSGQSNSNVLSTFQSDRTMSSPRIRNNKKFVNVGTRVPSPDKLLPYDFPNKRNVTLLEEYQMPRDNNSSCIYSELPPLSDTAQLPRDQLRLLDDAINIYMDTSLRRSRNDVYYNRPLPSKPDDPSDGNRQFVPSDG